VAFGIRCWFLDMVRRQRGWWLGIRDGVGVDGLMSVCRGRWEVEWILIF